MYTEHQVVVAPQRWLDPDHRSYRPGLSSYEAGGKYLDADTNEDLTGLTFFRGFISTTGPRPQMTVQAVLAAPQSGRKVHANLFKRSAGWRWLDDDDDRTVLVSVETGGRHFYTETVLFEVPITLARHPNKASEPRLRPCGNGDILFGPCTGMIAVRGREHPVYQSLIVH
jgi:hypothetical protein